MIKKKIKIISLLLIFFSLILFMTINSYKSTKVSVLESLERETDELRSNFVIETNRFTHARISELKLIAEHLPFIEEDKVAMIDFLHRQNDLMPYSTELSFSNVEGEVFATDGQQFPVQQRESFEKALTGQVVFSDVFQLHEDATQRGIAISVPVLKDSEIIGVISSVVNMSNLMSELIDESSLPGAIFLFKKTELIFSSIEGEQLKSLMPNVKKVLEEKNRPLNGSLLIDKKTAHYLKYANTKDNWTVIVDSSTNPHSKRLIDAFWQNILIVALTLLILSSVYIYICVQDKQEQVRTKRDLLTGLPNRIKLEEDLTIRLAENPEKSFVLLLINVDRFKEINEKVGYQSGDIILFELSKKLKAFSAKSEIYRVDGDEFIMLINEDCEAEQRSIAKKLIKKMEQPLQLCDEESIWLTFSIGVRSSKQNDQLDLIMQDATFACQFAKKQGGNQFIYFTEKLEEISARSRLVSRKLDTALINNEFYLLYQPIYGIDEETIVSYETLMRWKSPELGEVGPEEFINFLENSDLIISVGRWLIKEVALQVLRWESEGHKNFTVTLNVSVKQLVHADFLQDVRTILKGTGVNPGKIVFELTETIVVQHIDLAAEILSTLNSIGIRTALDDFGTGYSSLAILKVLPFQYVKVDRAFIMEVEIDDGVSKAILKGIIEIVNGLGLTTIVEGVETAEQFKLLKNLGAHRIQGYLISKPILPEAAIKLIGNKLVPFSEEQV